MEPARELISLAVDGPVAVIRLERPEKLNAFTYAMIDSLRGIVDRAVGDHSVVGIVITGSGREPAAGPDLDDLSRTAAGEGPDTLPERSSPDPDELPALFSYLLRVPKPVVAAVNGVCAGGGFVLAMMCDLRMAAEHGARFTTAFAKRGLVAEHGTSWLLPRLVGTNRALDLLWSSRVIDAAEAHRIGFVDRVVPDDRVVDEAIDYVRELAATSAPRSLATMKAQVYRGWSEPFDVAMRNVAVEIDAALAHPDAAEGVASFVEKRSHRFAPWGGNTR
jgi:enoyl-CoA hydratase/carnithine racemase